MVTMLSWLVRGRRRPSSGGIGFEETEMAFARAGILQAADDHGEAAEFLGAVVAIFEGTDALEFFCEFESDAIFDAVGEKAGALGGIKAGILRIEFAETNAAFFRQQPIPVATVAPLGEVVIGDGLAGDAFGKDALHFWQRVQPVDEVGTERAVVETAVEFEANGAGKAGDFSGSCSHRILFLTTDGHG
jgi:hypothetical protein